MSDIIIRLGDKGPHVEEIQKALSKQGYWPLTYFTPNFGKTTDTAVRKYQKDHGLVDDGNVGQKTLDLLHVDIKIEKDPIKKYDGVIIEGSTFHDKPIVKYTIKLNPEMVNEYLPALERVMGDQPKGFKLLCTIMAYKEGFRKGTRSYKTKNPGNIGNTDSGANKSNANLDAGILLQKNYILSIVEGKHKAYPMGKEMTIKPYYSPEIAKHQKLYGMSPYVPGYHFTFTGQLDQFVKIYSTGARGGNSYLSMIISYFAQNGISLTPESKIQDIIKLK